MGHIALYRSWRPQTFQEIVGQEHITTTLRNALKEGRLTHAYLFSGPRGTGKTSAAKILAKAVNCERGPVAEPCNECPSCKRITEGAVMDVIELDAASNNGVDEIRDIRDKVKYAPTEVRYKVYIIDEVHMLSIGASNALLKTLEEPPPHVLFILATTEPHKLPVTIVSRCQRYEFRRVALEEQVSRLQWVCRQEGLTVEDSALEHIARLSDGGMRDALSLLDQMISFMGNEITYQGVLSITGGIPSEQFERLAGAVGRQDLAFVLDWIESMMAEGKSAERCMESLIQYFRDLLLAGLLPPDVAGRFQRFAEPVSEETAKPFSRERIFQIIDVLNHYRAEMKYAAQPQILFEVAMMKICGSEEAASSKNAPDQTQEIERLKNRIDQLEKKWLEIGSAAAAVAQQSASAAGSSVAGSTVAGRGKAAEPGPSSARPKKTAAPAFSALKRTGKLEPYLQGADSPEFKEVLLKWNQVLSQVREEKVTVHAWLVNGEPVSAADGGVLVAFKNTIHRDTTEKPDNRNIIEQVMQHVLGQPLRLVTVMLKDWNEAVSHASDSGHPSTEELKLEHEDEAGEPKKEWIDEAIQLFGEDLVVIEDD